MSAPKTRIVSLKDPRLYLNRELSQLAFNRRVLEQAKDPSVPLLERVRFLSISSSNLDEFFEVRVAGLRQQLAYGLAGTDPDGLTASEVLAQVSKEAHALVVDQYKTLQEDLLPALEREGILMPRRTDWTVRQQKWLLDYFRKQVLPVLSPIGLDPAHPFPKILNKALNFVVLLDGDDAFHRESTIAVVRVPRSLPRLIRMPEKLSRAPDELVLLSSIIHAGVHELFPGMSVKGCFQFRVTRNSDLWVDEEEVDDLLSALKGELFGRHYGDAVRLETADNAPDDTVEFLLEQFGLVGPDLYRVNGPVNLHRLNALYSLVDRRDLKYPAYVPATPPVSLAADIFEAVKKDDVLLHHPYEPFHPVVELARRAAADPLVLAIKMTLYRTAPGSDLTNALEEAARAGKEVTVIVELKARFDEANNIELATRLQNAGANVVYGLVGHKTHSKLMLIVRREGRRLQRYVHLATGNYHSETARFYTDVGIMTANNDVTNDVVELFSLLTGLQKQPSLRKLVMAPFTLHKTVHALILDEIKNAKKGKKARIVARMNALTEPSIIQALYRASQAGVEIDLIIRGICCLRPGIPEISHNIRVRSVVDRYLEHSRVWHFHADGEDKVFIASADWMERNFFRRVETALPVMNPKLKARLIEEALTFYLEDTRQVWTLGPDGTYTRTIPAEGAPLSAQARLRARHAEKPMRVPVRKKSE
jgi:polyphosphate kinase